MQFKMSRGSKLALRSLLEDFRDDTNIMIREHEIYRDADEKAFTREHVFLREATEKLINALNKELG